MRTYLRLLFCPVNQCLIYDYRLSSGWGDPDTWAAFSLLLSIFVLGLTLFKKNRLLSFGILWFFLTLSIESTIIPFPDFIFEHRLYLPMFGFALFLTSLLWIASRSIRFFTVILLSLIFIFSGMTYFRNEAWKSQVSLAQDIVKKSPRAGISYSFLGDAYSFEVKDDKAAAICFQKALTLGYVTPWVYYNLATVYSRLGDQKKSLFFQSLISGSSVLKKTLSFYDNHALALIRGGKYPEAIEMLKTDIQMSP